MTDVAPGLKIAVVGSRGFRDTRLVDRKLSEMKPALVISGGAKGADQLGETWARRNGIETLIFHPDHKKYKHPYHHRNRLIAEACDVLVAFWDGRSSGTKYTIEYARRIGKPVVIVRF
jgi:predicted Rossmann fold nucleotide-binding protein DprA/Smf involved in DNA uptake